MVRSATSSHLKEKVVQSPALKQAVGVIEPACRRCGQGGGVWSDADRRMAASSGSLREFTAVADTMQSFTSSFLPTITPEDHNARAAMTYLKLATNKQYLQTHRRAR